MEKLYPSNKVRFRHLYDKTDKEEQMAHPINQGD